MNMILTGMDEALGWWRTVQEFKSQKVSSALETSCQRKWLFAVPDCNVGRNVGQSLSLSLTSPLSAWKSCCSVGIELNIDLSIP